MKFFPICFFLLIVLFFAGCKNELKLNAPYEEIPSIYAVLNPQESVQMIRVNKVFLGEGDANKMAKVADSINYQPGELIVMLERTVDGIVSDAADDNSGSKFILFKDSLVTANPGAFNTSQRVYVTNKKLHTSGIYKLTVKNIKTQNVFTATTTAFAPVVGSFKPLVPPTYPYSPTTPPEEYIKYNVNSPKPPYEVRHTVNKAAVYELTLRMHYYDSVSFVEKYNRFLDYNVGQRNLREVQTLSGITFVSYTFNGSGIFSATGNFMAKQNHNILGRKMFAIEYIVHSSTQDYLDYQEYVRPSLSISQNKPLFSNFKDKRALGLFTFRTRFSIIKNIDNEYISSFASHPSTCSYKFYNSRLEQPGCR